MSGIARVLLEMGHAVSGSDLESNCLTRKLEAMGGRIFEGHAKENLPGDVGLVVYSSSVERRNPELAAARGRNIRVVHRAEVLGELFNKKKGIGVTGTHGKTTTTSLIAVMLKNRGLDPTAIIGGEVADFLGNARMGNGAYLVAEADESDSSFLNLKPFYSVITNIEMEHLDHFKTMADVKGAYRSFLNNTRKGGMIFYNYDDKNIRDIMEGFKGESASFGFSGAADIYPADIKMDGFDTSFKCVYKNKTLGEIRLKIPGIHNVLNGLAAVLVGLNLGLTFRGIAGSIKDFRGAKRRFQLRTDAGGVMLIDDYAHHPTEIRAVLNACRNWKHKRLIAVFQPHRYTRTLFLADDFGKCFKLADKLILTDIYAASEKAIKGVSIKSVYRKVLDSGMKDVVMVKRDDIPEYVMKFARRGDMIIVMGAGDIKKVADKLSDRLESSFPSSNPVAQELAGMIKGKVKARESLARHSSFRIGGRADTWAEPSDAADLKKVLIFARRRKVPVFIMGNGSNVLVSDGGFRGIVVNLGSSYFKRLKISGRKVRVGGGFSLPKLVSLACGSGLAGLESLVGIPGTVGGAIYMNAGGSANPMYRNMGDLISSLKVMDYGGRIKEIRKEETDFTYRSSNLGPCVILEAVLNLDKGDRGALTGACAQFLKMKRQKHPLDVPSAGCVFKNPPDSQFTCGQMIDTLGLKGMHIGGAHVSEKHANFIINRMGDATCDDVLALIGLIQKKVKESYDITLELEIKII